MQAQIRVPTMHTWLGKKASPGGEALSSVDSDRPPKSVLPALEFLPPGVFDSADQVRDLVLAQFELRSERCPDGSLVPVGDVGDTAVVDGECEHCLPPVPLCSCCSTSMIPQTEDLSNPEEG